jgi:hypothetical protein
MGRKIQVQVFRGKVMTEVANTSFQSADQRQNVLLDLANYDLLLCFVAVKPGHKYAKV